MSRRISSTTVLPALILSLVAACADEPVGLEPEAQLARGEKGRAQPLNASAVAAGAAHACAIGVDRKTYCWGRNDLGQLGAGTNDPSTTPVEVTGGHAFDEITSGGHHHTCGRTGSGEVWCWGSNAFGQLGDGSITDSDAPVRAAPGLTFRSVDAGTYHTCGIATDELAYCWGSNGPPIQIINSAFPIPGGVGRAFGTATTMMCDDPNWRPDNPYRGPQWHCSPTPVAVPGPEFTSISAGLWASCGLTPSGAAHCTGWDALWQLGDADFFNKEEMTPVGGGLSFDAVDLGGMVGCGLVGTSAYCWGGLVFDNGASGDGTILPWLGPAAPWDGNITPRPVAGGLAFASVHTSNANDTYAHTCGLTTSGEAYCWGNNQRGELGTEMPLEACGFLFPWEFWLCSSRPLPVAPGANNPNRYRALATGANFTCGVGHNRHVYCWGANNSGQLGDGTTVDRSTPVQAVRR